MDWVLGRIRGWGVFYRGNEEYFLDVIMIYEDCKVDFCGGEL